MDQAATGGLSQKPTDNPPFTAQWPHKKVWLVVRSTHKQILLLVEHKQLKWENAAARDAIRAAQLLIAKEEAIQAKFFNLPAKSTNTGNKPQPKEELKPCQSFNNSTCTHLKDQVIDETRTSVPIALGKVTIVTATRNQHAPRREERHEFTTQARSQLRRLQITPTSSRIRPPAAHSSPRNCIGPHGYTRT